VTGQRSRRGRRASRASCFRTASWHPRVHDITATLAAFASGRARGGWLIARGHQGVCPGASRSSLDERPDLVVRRLAEVRVIQRDRHEVVHRQHGDDLVGVRPEVAHSGRRRDRHGDDHGTGTPTPDGLDRREGRIAGGESVVDDDHDASI
jgi:hypothetical protein